MSNKSNTTNGAAPMQAAEIIKASPHGKIEYSGRNFYALEIGRQSPGHFGPWAVVENNGGGMKPIYHREGISGSRKNAFRVLESVVNGIVKADQRNARVMKSGHSRGCLESGDVRSCPICSKNHRGEEVR